MGVKESKALEQEKRSIEDLKRSTLPSSSTRERCKKEAEKDPSDGEEGAFSTFPQAPWPQHGRLAVERRGLGLLRARPVPAPGPRAKPAASASSTRRRQAGVQPRRHLGHRVLRPVEGLAAGLQPGLAAAEHPGVQCQLAAGLDGRGSANGPAVRRPLGSGAVPSASGPAGALPSLPQAPPRAVLGLLAAGAAAGHPSEHRVGAHLGRSGVQRGGGSLAGLRDRGLGRADQLAGPSDVRHGASASLRGEDRRGSAAYQVSRGQPARCGSEETGTKGPRYETDAKDRRMQSNDGMCHAAHLYLALWLSRLPHHGATGPAGGDGRALLLQRHGTARPLLHEQAVWPRLGAVSLPLRAAVHLRQRKSDEGAAAAATAAAAAAATAAVTAAVTAATLAAGTLQVNGVSFLHSLFSSCYAPPFSQSDRDSTDTDLPVFASGQTDDRSTLSKCV
eukprot:scaffold149_cov315-Pinguiococcus_pyrenoidosus.AAC.16